MKLLTKLALVSSLVLGSTAVISTNNVNSQVVQAAKKDQGVTMKSLIKHPRTDNIHGVDSINWNPWFDEKPSDKYNSVGCSSPLTSIVKYKNRYFAKLGNVRYSLNNLKAPTIYTAKANVPVMAYRVTKTWNDGSGLVGMKDGKWHKTPINAGYISKGETRALLSKKRYTFNGIKYYMIYSDGYTTTNEITNQTDIGSSRIEYIKVSDFKKFKKGGKIQISTEGGYLTNCAYHFYPNERVEGGSIGFFCPNRKVFYDLKH